MNNRHLINLGEDTFYAHLGWMLFAQILQNPGSEATPQKASWPVWFSVLLGQSTKATVPCIVVTLRQGVILCFPKVKPDVFSESLFPHLKTIPRRQVQPTSLISYLLHFRSKETEQSLLILRMILLAGSLKREPELFFPYSFLTLNPAKFNLCPD